MQTYVQNKQSESRSLHGNPKAANQASIAQFMLKFANANAATVQRESMPEEEEVLQGKFETAQRETLDDEEVPLQAKVSNNTGLPDNLKSGIENMSGYSMDDVQVHYNSSKPAQLQALAYTQGTDIHVAPGQEKHLAHEAWHVVQQKQGRVQPTMQLQGVNVNDNAGLEHEADVMGARSTVVSKRTSYQLYKKSKKTIKESFQFKMNIALREKLISMGRSASTIKKLTDLSYSARFILYMLNHGASVLQIINTERFSKSDLLKLWHRLYDWNQIEQLAATPYSANAILAMLNASGNRWNEMIRLHNRIRSISVAKLSDVIPGYDEKICIADAAIAYAKTKITAGPGNQAWARKKHGNQGAINYMAMIDLVNKTPNKDRSGNYGLDWVLPRRIGAAVEATGGGNCQDIAALTYNYLREHSTRGWTICFVVNYSAKHSFATIGNPNSDDHKDVIVADAWVQFPKAIALSKHFCDKGTISVIKAKKGGKRGRMRNLQSKYYDTSSLPSEVNEIKRAISMNPIFEASWNHNYPEGG